MTYKTVPTVFVTCDSSNHPGDFVFKVEFRPGVAPNDALREAGWVWSTSSNKHYCPDCARVARMRN